MATPRLFFGGSEGVLLSPDAAVFEDDDAPYDLLAEPNVSAPAGPSGECIFPILHLTTKRFADATLVITPIVDEVELTPQTLALAGAVPAKGLVEVTELDLSEPYPSALDPQIRNAPRGSAFSVRVAGVVTGVVELSVLQVEYETVRESRLAAATT